GGVLGDVTIRVPLPDPRIEHIRGVRPPAQHGVLTQRIPGQNRERQLRCLHARPTIDTHEGLSALSPVFLPSSYAAIVRCSPVSESMSEAHPRAQDVE